MNHQPTIDLILLGAKFAAFEWPLGRTLVCDAAPQAIYEFFERDIIKSPAVAAAVLFWDPNLGAPDVKKIRQLLKTSTDLWHAGLKLGTAGLPGTIDYVQPTWMLNRDPDSEIEATSWRMSFRVCLIRTEVLRQMGGPRPDFQTIEAAALEMGHRFISRGVLMRHVPGLIAPLSPVGRGQGEGAEKGIPFEDELRFVYYRFGKKWAYWTLMRGVLSGYVSLVKAFGAWQKVICHCEPQTEKGTGTQCNSYLSPFRSGNDNFSSNQSRVSVLIPTLDRYRYLRPLLNQLRKQTVKPLEIIIVDQTSLESRDFGIAKDFSDLPLRIIYQDHPGQCSSRNAGLQIVQGDYVLFLDDDDEIAPDLIEKHLKNLHDFNCEVSSGIAEEDGAGPLPKNFTYLRISDVFPTNNTMIRREVLKQSGLFDLAYDRKQRADADLGMRIYLSGATMILNPDISVLHHHAPQGGLRAHKARIVTYASSRKSLFQRHLPNDSEIYLGLRYFSSRQVRESIWLRVFGTFSMGGPMSIRILKVIVSLILLPNSLWKIRQRAAYAQNMMRSFPSMLDPENFSKAKIGK